MLLLHVLLLWSWRGLCQRDRGPRICVGRYSLLPSGLSLVSQWWRCGDDGGVVHIKNMVSPTPRPPHAAMFLSTSYIRAWDCLSVLLLEWWICFVSLCHACNSKAYSGGADDVTSCFLGLKLLPNLLMFSQFMHHCATCEVRSP